MRLTEEMTMLLGTLVVPAACLAVAYPLCFRLLAACGRGGNPRTATGVAPAVALCAALGSAQLVLRGVPKLPPPLAHDGVWFLAAVGAVLLLPEEWIPRWRRFRLLLLFLACGVLVLWILHPVSWSWSRRESAGRFGGAACILVLLVSLSEQAIGESAPHSTLAMLGIICVGAAACIFQGGYLAAAQWAASLGACMFTLALFPRARHHPLGMASTLVVSLVLFAALLLGCFHAEMPLSQAFLICGAWLGLARITTLESSPWKAGLQWIVPAALTSLAVFLTRMRT